MDNMWSVFGLEEVHGFSGAVVLLYFTEIEGLSTNVLKAAIRSSVPELAS